MIKQVAGAAALAWTEGCAPVARMSAAPRRLGSSSASQWDMSWVDRIQTPRRMAFDTSDVQAGLGLSWVSAYLAGAADAYGSTKEVSTVLCLRHASVPIALGDNLWDRLALGDQLKLKDPTTGEVTRRNPFINFKFGDRYSPVGLDATLDGMIAKGTVVLACNSALSGYVGMLVHAEKLNLEEARRQVLASLVPGVILMPSGVFAVAAAQDAGCGYVVVR